MYYNKFQSLVKSNRYFREIIHIFIQNSRKIDRKRVFQVAQSQDNKGGLANKSASTENKLYLI